jgi:succinate dehydrogenase / fumarate reductase, cytochrome b subunit
MDHQTGGDVINALRTSYSVLRYRGGIDQWLWAVHRLAGLGVLLFLSIHIFDIFLVGFGPTLFNDLLFLYKGPGARVLDIVLVFGLLYHGLNGLRLTLLDFVPRLTGIRTELFLLQMVLFLGLYVPAGVGMGIQFFGVAGATLLTLAVLALPTGIALAGWFLPFGSAVVEVSGVNYTAALSRLNASSGRPNSAFEFNM